MVNSTSVNAGEITQRLRRWRRGDRQALDELAPLVYDHLRVLAGSYVRGSGPARPIQPTELVDELFLELLKAQRIDIQDRNHFFAFSARVMRRILIGHVRAAKAEKRGGDLVNLPLDQELAWVGDQGDLVPLDLEARLNELEQFDEPAVRAIELRYLFGFTAEEAAGILGTSKSTVDRHVRFGLSWLHSRLHAGEQN
ncbi:MAG: RNA polymerase subunit sigma-70 [Bryobacterales bacterium]|nr:RNA polymerase subunit sigma-70 [Bryobacterales bacterium]